MAITLWSTPVKSPFPCGQRRGRHRDSAVEQQAQPGDNAASSGIRIITAAARCGTWGRARDEQNGADLR